MIGRFLRLCGIQKPYNYTLGAHQLLWPRGHPVGVVGIDGCMEVWSSESPDRDWLIAKRCMNSETLTWSGAKVQIERAAAWFCAHYARGDKIGLLAQNSPNWVIAYLAILSAGLIVVPIAPKSYSAELMDRARQENWRALIIGKLSVEARLDKRPPSMRIIRLPEAEGLTDGLGWQVLLNHPGEKAGEVNQGGVSTPSNRFAWSGLVESAHHLRLAVQYIRCRGRLYAHLPLWRLEQQISVIALSLLTGSSIHFAELDQPLIADLRQIQPTLLSAGPDFFAGLADHFESRYSSLVEGDPDCDFYIDFQTWMKNNSELKCTTSALVFGGELSRKSRSWLRVAKFPVVEIYGVPKRPVVAARKITDERDAGYDLLIPQGEIHLTADHEICVRPIGEAKPLRSPHHGTRFWCASGDVGRLAEGGQLHLLGKMEDLHPG